MSIELAAWYIEGLGVEGNPFVRGDPMNSIKALWPLLDILADADRAAPLKYDERFCAEADAAIVKLCETGEFEVGAGPAGVLLERLRQMIVSLTAHLSANEMVMQPPPMLAEGHKSVATAALWLHEMTLPFAPGTVMPPERLWQ